jgi:hypothetical protein
MHLQSRSAFHAGEASTRAGAHTRYATNRRHIRILVVPTIRIGITGTNGLNRNWDLIHSQFVGTHAVLTIQPHRSTGMIVSRCVDETREERRARPFPSRVAGHAQRSSRYGASREGG